METVEKGQKIVNTIFTILVLFPGLIFLGQLMLGGLVDIRAFWMIVSSALLCYLIFRGHTWAKYITGVLAAAAGIAGIWFYLPVLSNLSGILAADPISTFTIVMSFFYILFLFISSFLLFTSSDVQSFIDYKSGKIQDQPLVVHHNEGEFMGPHYYVMFHDQKFGPYSADKMRSLKREGKVKSDTIVSVDNETEWHKMREYKDLVA